MSARSSSLLGYGLYFIDVLACVLFSLSLALVTARFGRELSVPVELPRLERGGGAGTDLSAPAIALRSEAGETRIYWGEEPVTLAELAERLRVAPPPSVVVRAEETALSRVIAAAHEAGVSDIQLAYESVHGSAGGQHPEGGTP